MDCCSRSRRRVESLNWLDRKENRKGGIWRWARMLGKDCKSIRTLLRVLLKEPWRVWKMCSQILSRVQIRVDRQSFEVSGSVMWKMKTKSILEGERRKESCTRYLDLPITTILK